MALQPLRRIAVPGENGIAIALVLGASGYGRVAAAGAADDGKGNRPPPRSLSAKR